MAAPESLSRKSINAFLILCNYYENNNLSNLTLRNIETKGIRLSYDTFQQTIRTYLVPVIKSCFDATSVHIIDAITNHELGNIPDYNTRHVNYLTRKEIVKFLNEYIDTVCDSLGNLDIVNNMFNITFDINDEDIREYYLQRQNYLSPLAMPPPAYAVAAPPPAVRHPSAAAAAASAENSEEEIQIPRPNGLTRKKIGLVNTKLKLVKPPRRTEANLTNSNYTNNKLAKYSFLKHKMKPGNVYPPEYKILPNYKNRNPNVTMDLKGKDIISGDPRPITNISNFIRDNNDDVIIFKVNPINSPPEIYLWIKSLLLQKLNSYIMFPCRKGDGTFGRQSNIRLDIPLYSMQQVLGRKINILKDELDAILNTPGNVVVSLYKTDKTFPSVASIQVVLDWYDNLMGALHCAGGDPEELWMPEQGKIIPPKKKSPSKGPYRNRKNSFNENNDSPNSNSNNNHSNKEYNTTRNTIHVRRAMNALTRNFGRMNMKN